MEVFLVRLQHPLRISNKTAIAAIELESLRCDVLVHPNTAVQEENFIVLGVTVASKKLVALIQAFGLA